MSGALIRRRDFLALAGASAAFPRGALAQQAKVPLIVFIWSPGTPPAYMQAYRDGLADFGYIEGTTIRVQALAPPSADDYAAFAAMAVAAKPDVIVTQSDPLAVVVKSLTTSIPVVFGAGLDPVGNGAVESLSRPGGNVTGTSVLAPELTGKQLSLLKELIPNLRRVALLNLPAIAAINATVEQAAAASATLGLEAVIVDFMNPPESFVAQFPRVPASAPQAMYAPASTYFGSNSDALADLQIQFKLPLMTSNAVVYPRALIGYGPNTVTEIRKTGAYIDAILKGAKPGDLPVQQPTTFDLGVNLATAKSLGITVPPSILAQATIVTQ